MDIKRSIKNLFLPRFSEIDIIIIVYLFILMFIESPRRLIYIYMFLEKALREANILEKISVVLSIGMLIIAIFLLVKKIIQKKEVSHGPEKDFASMLFYCFIFILAILIFIQRIKSIGFNLNINDIFIILGGLRALLFFILFLFMPKHKFEYFLADRLEDIQLKGYSLGAILILTPLFYLIILPNLSTSEKLFLSYIYTSVILSILYLKLPLKQS